ncbi:MAG: gamma-glutamyltransferase [Betaproteobacteria bacterium]|nr:gamma-glutamyltransferase [Betaproteobacteria bacterium]
MNTPTIPPRLLSFARARRESARAFFVVLFACLVTGTGAADAAQRYAVASAHPLATRVGEEVLANGGNAFDAAIAVTAALAVVEPYSSGFGGGGFFLLHRASDGRDIVVDAREMAPIAATRDMYLDANGDPVPRASLDGAKAAGIPGVPAGLAYIAQHYGSRPLAQMVAPAIALAKDGFAVGARYQRAAHWREQVLRRDERTSATFLVNGDIPEAGHVVKQPDFAHTLEAFASEGADGFYRGPVAAEMVRAVRAGGGIWTAADLEGYHVVEREPYRFTYRGARIVTTPLPSSGGLTLAQALHIIECFDLSRLSETDRVHVIVEAMRRAYQDRARYLGDADFVSVPRERLGSREYAKERAASIDMAHATPSASLDPAPAVHEGTNTTHFSIIDAQGNRVAATLSINAPFGSGLVAGASGVLLNNEMDDFAIAPHRPNLYGLTGAFANSIAPRKRPLSSMSPTFVEDSRGVLVFGTPGGSRIISMVLLGILDYVGSPKVDIEHVVAAPRYHHQYLPDHIEYELGTFSEAWADALRAKGHVVQEGRRRWGNMQAVFVDAVTGDVTAASDPRGKAGHLF